MLEPELMALATQFGTAGLVAWMWLTERRAASAREAQLQEAHEQMREQRMQLDALLSVASDSARATTAVEASQRALAEAVDRLARSLAGAGGAEPRAAVGGDHRAGAA